jgi:hemoglobin
LSSQDVFRLPEKQKVEIQKDQAVSIYEKYGGYEFFHGCIYELYLSMFEHPEISYHFVGVDIERLSKHQAQFLVRAIGGPDLYKGRPIIDVHKEMKVSLFEFKEIASAFRNVFLKRGVSVEDTDIIMSFVGSRQRDIVTVKSNFMDRFMKPIYRWFKKIARKIFHSSR